MYQKYSALLSAKEKEGLDGLYGVYGKWPTELEEMWALMDKVWDEIGCDNKILDDEKLATYYSHPVWLLNGLFAESHSLSIEHRENISDWVAQKKIRTMLDYGGGFCTLGRLVSEKCSETTIDVLEPFPTLVLTNIVAQYSSLKIVASLSGSYECISALDVLEHVPDPLKTLGEMINSLHPGGYLLTGNCFLPVIKCHLPVTFHLHSTFQKIATNMGLEYLCNVPGNHVEVYRKVGQGKINWPKIRLLEFLSVTKYRTKQLTQQMKKVLS